MLPWQKPAWILGLGVDNSQTGAPGECCNEGRDQGVDRLVQIGKAFAVMRVSLKAIGVLRESWPAIQIIELPAGRCADLLNVIHVRWGCESASLSLESAYAPIQRSGAHGVG